MSNTYFKNVPNIKYEGPESDNPLAFKHYNKHRIVGGKTMGEHFKFAIAWWHTLCNTGGDPFGPGTIVFPWDLASNPLKRAKEKVDAGFEILSKLGIDYFCFHDVDLIEEGDNGLVAFEKQVEQITDYILLKMADSPIKPLWGTANLFSHPRYMNGAATNPDFAVVAHAAAQVKIAMDATIKLGGENYVFWGGREGYMSLLNTDMKRELDHLGRFLHMAKDYAR
ncbi:MAG: xylose isomerase, partial [Bacteroidota bacterium]